MNKPFVMLATAGMLSLAFATAPASAQEAGLEDEIAVIVEEGTQRSNIPMQAHDLLDRIGARLTNSPSMRRAEDWAVQQFGALGLTARKEGFHFGRGWEMIGSDVRMIAPRPLELTAMPVTWTPPTNGTIEAEVVVAPMDNPSHFAAYRGQLRGKIVLVSLPGNGDEPTTPAFRRLDAAQIAERDVFPMPDNDPHDTAQAVERAEFEMRRDAFLASEGALAWARISARDGKLLHGNGYTFESGNSPVLPGFEIAAEDYRRLARLARSGPAPHLSLTSNVRFVDNDPMAYNIIADLPGTDASAGYVMAGAHFDSWTAGDGAVDNGAGTLVVLEAARLLTRLGIRPRRTIRFALWNGEEQGLLGSTAYINQHIARREGDSERAWLGRYYEFGSLYPVTPLPGFTQLKAYFNLDNGSGRIRGIQTEGNVAAQPLLQRWLAPFADMGATGVVTGRTGGTDHVFMAQLGLPAYQFIQDPLDYSSRLHHTSIDTYDHMRLDDLRQAAVIMAGLLLQAANSPSEMPREPLPTAPGLTDPFEYRYPPAEARD
jgi:carboxypeptidase Q